MLDAGVGSTMPVTTWIHQFAVLADDNFSAPTACSQVGICSRQLLGMLTLYDSLTRLAHEALSGMGL